MSTEAESPLTNTASCTYCTYPRTILRKTSKKNYSASNNADPKSSKVTFIDKVRRQPIHTIYEVERINYDYEDSPRNKRCCVTF